MSSCCDQSHDDLSEAEEQKQLRTQFILAITCLITFLIAWAGERSGNISHQKELFLYAIAYFTGGYCPAMGVWNDLKEFKFNVNFLMVTAALGAALIGEPAEGAVLMFLFSLSGALEHYASGRTRKAIRSLMKISPSEATILKDGKEISIPVSELKLGDLLVIRPGERIAADGIIKEGSTSIDQSSLTGEPIPVDRTQGDRVLAGTINRFGTIQIEMDRAVQDTTLAKIFKVIEEAQQDQAPTQRLIEKYGAPYTIVILSATCLTFLGGLWWAQEPWRESLYRAMTLMVVSSPCALVLSIPSAVLASIASAAWHGILFKGGRAVEVIGKVQAIAFDKTGTLTDGKPSIQRVRYADHVKPDEVLAEVASLEQNSEHPLAQVIVNEAIAKGLTLTRASESKALPGMGMEGCVQGEKIRVGSEAFVCLYGGMEEWVRQTLTDYRAHGLTCLIAAKQKPLAVFGVSDRLREKSAQTIKNLHDLGLKTIMLTGDHQASAAEFAKKLDLHDFKAGLLPHQKVDAIKELSKQHGLVAMVGDGINDAPALVTADVGIAMGVSGSDVALENADVVVMSDAIERIPEIIRLGRKTQRVITQNLIFAMSVIACLIIGTFLGKITLAMGVIGHEGSTVLVVFNSLRLLHFNPKSAVGVDEIA